MGDKVYDNLLTRERVTRRGEEGIEIVLSYVRAEPCRRASLLAP